MATITQIIDRTFTDYGYFYLSDDPVINDMITVEGSATYRGTTWDFDLALPTTGSHEVVVTSPQGLTIARLSYIRTGPQHYNNCIIVFNEAEDEWSMTINQIVYHVEGPEPPAPPEYGKMKEGVYVNIYEVTPDPLTGGGIFSALGDTEMPWYETLGAGMSLKLDLAYYGVISGSKIISPFVDKLLNDDGVIPVATMDTIAGVVQSMYTPKWSKLWDTLIAEYDPIENYNMTEEMTDDETVTEYGRSHTRTDNLAHSETRTDNLAHSETRTDNLAHSETRTDNLAHSETRTDNLAHSETRTDNLAHSETRTDNLTHTVDEEEKTTPGITTTRQDAIRGFNSNADVDTDKVTESASGYTTVEHDNTEHNTGTQSTSGSDTGTQSTQGSNTGTQSTQGSDTGTQSTQGSNTGTQGIQGTDTGTVGTAGSNTGTVTDADTGSDTQTRNYTLTRSGNIGVTTTQQMLQQQRELYAWNYFYEVVFPDVDKLLTIQTY